MVSEGMREELLRQFGCSLQPYLCAAQVRLVLVSYEFYRLIHQVLQIARQLHQAVLAEWQFAMDSYSYARFKMRVIHV